MSIYPSLEDMKYDQLLRAQNQERQQQPQIYSPSIAAPQPSIMYPSLGDYMGLELSQAMIAANMPEYNQIAIMAAVRHAILFVNLTLDNFIFYLRQK